MSGMTGAVAEAVGMGLLHFTWMGLLLGAGLESLLALLRGQSPRLRYGVALSGFAVLAFLPVFTIGTRLATVEEQEKAPRATWAYTLPAADSGNAQLPIVTPREGGPMLYVDPPETSVPMLELRPSYMNPVFELPLLQDSPAVTLEVAEEEASAAPSAGGALVRFVHTMNATIGSRAEAAAPWLAAIWIAGVLLLGLRLLGGLHYTRWLKSHGAKPLDARWQARVDQLCESACLRKGVRIVQSTLTKVPVVVGWFSPVVLMPVALFTGLPPKQVELLLAHELAHIKRLDPLVNLFQVAVETLLFFHPVVWRLSRRIRDERELCCDDIALAICGGRAEYAQALLHIAERTVSEPPLALAAGGGKLQQRINRILGRPVGRDRLSTPGALGLLVLTLCGALMTGLAWAEFSQESTRRPEVHALHGGNFVLVPTDAARDQLFDATTGGPLLAPYYEIPAFDLQWETYDGSTSEAPAPAAKPSQDFTTTLTEDTVTVLDGSVAEEASDALEPPTPTAVLQEPMEVTPAGEASTDLPSALVVAEEQGRFTADSDERSNVRTADASEAPEAESLNSPDAATSPEAAVESSEAVPALRDAEGEAEAHAAPRPVSIAAPPARKEADAPYPQGDPETVERLQRGPINVQYGSALEGFHLSRELSMLRVATGIRFLLDAKTIAPRAQGFGADAPLRAGYATDGVLPVMSERETDTAEAWLKRLTTPLGLSYLVYPDTVIISTPERLAEIAGIYEPRLHSINARYYRVSDPELVSRLDAQLDGEQGAAVFPAEELIPGSEPRTALDTMAGVSLLANHSATAADNNSWWHDDPGDNRNGDAMTEPHRLYKFEETERRDHAGCGGNLTGFGPPIMIYDTALPSAMAPIGMGIQALAYQVAPVLFNQIVDLNPPRPKAAERRTSGRRTEKGEGQDRPERSKWFDASGIVAAISVRATGDVEGPEVHLCIQQNLFHWNLANRGEWQAIECAGRFISPTYVYAWPTSEAGTYAMAVVHIERSRGDRAGTGMQTALVE